MKKIYLIILLSALSATAFSQRMAGGLKMDKRTNFSLNNSRVQNDTLWGLLDQWSTPALYTPTGATGYVCGNNSYDDKTQAQVILNESNTPMKIDALILWFGGISLNSGNASSKVVAKTFEWDGSVPGKVTSSADLLVDDIDTTSGSWNIVTFNTPASFNGGFAVGIDVTNVKANDYVGLFASEDGGGTTYGDLSFVQIANDSWVRYTAPLANWGWELDVQMGIFPIVDTDVVGLKNIINDKFKIYQNMPNPFSNTSYVFYELTEAANVLLEVFDMTGKSLVVYNEGFKSAGKSMIEIDATDFPSGIYHYTITINGQKTTKKMVVFK